MPLVSCRGIIHTIISSLAIGSRGISHHSLLFFIIFLEIVEGVTKVNRKILCTVDPQKKFFLVFTEASILTVFHAKRKVAVD